MSIFYRVSFALANTEDLRQAFALQDSTGAPVDLTGATLRLALEAPSGVDVLEASTANGRIAIVDAANGQFEIVVPAAVLRPLPAGVYRHDLLLTHAGRIRRLWDGALTLSEGVTQ